MPWGDVHVASSCWHRPSGPCSCHTNSSWLEEEEGGLLGAAAWGHAPLPAVSSVLVAVGLMV